MEVTNAARNAIAYVHLTGHTPKFLRHATFMSMLRHIVSVPVAEIDFGAPGYRSYNVKSEYVAEIEKHPMVVKFGEMLADGWKLDPDLGRRKVSSGVWLKKLGESRMMEVTVYPDGHLSRIF